MISAHNQSRIPLYNVFMPREVDQMISDVIHSGRLASGSAVTSFEMLLSRYIGNPFITTTADFSTSMAISLFMSGVRPGDEVIMSPLVCLATSTPVRNLFADIRWCDVDPETGNIDPLDIEKKISNRTKAIVVSHWAGNPANLDRIISNGRSLGIPIIEDAGEALGADYMNCRIGATGADYSVFSFYANRQLTTIEGGAIACLREVDIERARMLKHYGIHQPSFRCEDGEINPNSDIPVAGWNCSMTNVAATIGIAQMNHIHEIVSRHQENGRFYDERLAGLPKVKLLKRPANSNSAYWVYTFLSEEREELLRYLHRENIEASRVHIRNDIYTAFGTIKTDLPGVESFSNRYLSIPCGWWISDVDRERILDTIIRFSTLAA